MWRGRSKQRQEHELELSTGFVVGFCYHKAADLRVRQADHSLPCLFCVAVIRQPFANRDSRSTKTSNRPSRSTEFEPGREALHVPDDDPTCGLLTHLGVPEKKDEDGLLRLSDLPGSSMTPYLSICPLCFECLFLCGAEVVLTQHCGV